MNPENLVIAIYPKIKKDIPNHLIDTLLNSDCGDHAMKGIVKQICSNCNCQYLLYGVVQPNSYGGYEYIKCTGCGFMETQVFWGDNSMYIGDSDSSDEEIDEEKELKKHEIERKCLFYEGVEKKEIVIERKLRSRAAVIPAGPPVVPDFLTPDLLSSLI